MAFAVKKGGFPRSLSLWVAPGRRRVSLGSERCVLLVATAGFGSPFDLQVLWLQLMALAGGGMVLAGAREEGGARRSDLGRRCVRRKDGQGEGHCCRSQEIVAEKRKKTEQKGRRRERKKKGGGREQAWARLCARGNKKGKKRKEGGEGR